MGKNQVRIYRYKQLKSLGFSSVESRRRRDHGGEVPKHMRWVLNELDRAGKLGISVDELFSDDYILKRMRGE